MSYMCLYRTLLVAGLGVLAATPQKAADVQRLTLAEAVNLAINQNRALKIARLKVAESEQKRAAAKASYFPELKNQSSVFNATAKYYIEVPRGSLGVIPGAGPVPTRDFLIDQGNQTYVSSGTSLNQPLTQLIRIHQNDRIAKWETAVSRDEARKAETRFWPRASKNAPPNKIPCLPKRVCAKVKRMCEMGVR
jgi:outer membrane protein TolC